MTAKKAAIIGAGITGLSTAFFLLKKGYQVTVFEKEGAVGGLLSSFKVENAYLEKFYHHFFVQDSAAFELLKELGIKSKLYWKYPRMGFYAEGRSYPFTTPFDLLRFSPVSLPDRVRFGLFSLRAKKVREWLPLEDMTAKEWIEKELGKDVYQKVWKPMLRGKFGSFADRVPASFAWSRLKARSLSRGRLGTRERLAYLKGGYKVLTDALAERVKKMGGKIRLSYGISEPPVPDYDLTVVTTPNVLSFPGIEYLGNICVVLKLRKRFSRFYWTNIGDESIPFCALIEHTNAFDDKGFKGSKLIYISNYVEHSDPLWGSSDKEIFKRYKQGLRQIDPGFNDQDVAQYFVFRELFAQPVPTLGHSKIIPPFKVKDRLYYVSNAQVYPEDRGVSDSIKLAKRFVETLG